MIPPLSSGMNKYCSSIVFAKPSGFVNLIKEIYVILEKLLISYIYSPKYLVSVKNKYFSSFDINEYPKPSIIILLIK